MSARRFRASLAELVPYTPGKPIEEVQREHGLDRVVKLASNEGPFPPFPAALAAMERVALELNRYPDGSAYGLCAALAARHGVTESEVIAGAGADGVIDLLSQASLDAGDEVVCGWPSFPSYVIDAMKLGAVVRKVPLHDHVYDLDAMLEAIGPRTKIVYVCHPNNPTGTANGREELRRFVAQVPPHVIVVIDQAYFEYIDDPDYADAIAELYDPDGNVVVLRTFSKIYGLAGARVGYGIAPADVVSAAHKVRPAFHLTAIAQAAAVASIGEDHELANRRALNAEGRALLEGVLREHGLDPVTPSYGNFLYVDVGDARRMFDQLLRQGVIVRPLEGFGAPSAVRVSVGTTEELEHFRVALGHVLSGVSS